MQHVSDMARMRAAAPSKGISISVASWRRQHQNSAPRIAAALSSSY